MPGKHLREECERFLERLLPWQIAIRPRVTFEVDQTRIAELAEVMVHRRACEAGLGNQLGHAVGAACHEREDLDTLGIGQCPAKRRDPLLGSPLRPRLVDDEPRPAVLGEDEPRLGLDVGDEKHALGLRLGDVAIAGGDLLDRLRERSGRERRSGLCCSSLKSVSLRVDQQASAHFQRMGQPRPRLLRVEREQHRQRVARPAAVIPLVGEQLPARRTIARCGGLDRVRAAERAPRPRVGAEQVAAQLHWVQPVDRVHQAARVVRGPEVERHAEQVEPALTGGVTRGDECIGELGLDTRPCPHRRARERDEELERRACGDVDAGRGQLGWSVSDNHRTRTIAMRLS